MPRTIGHAALLFPPRHPAEELSGTRLQQRSPKSAVAVTRLPHGMRPTLGHLGVLADVAAGQCLSAALPAGQDVRTISLHLQLLELIGADELVVGTGEPRQLGGGSGLSTAELAAPDGRITALSTLRFMVVDAQTHVPDPDPADLTSLNALLAPADWDPALGLGRAETHDGASRIPMTPLLLTRNAAGIFHGGLHVRALELACRSAVGLPSADEGFRLADIDVTYHRPLPVDGETRWMLTGDTVRRGRRVIVATAQLASPDGKLRTTAHATFLRGE